MTIKVPRDLLGDIVAQLVKEGLTFEASFTTDDLVIITLTGGY